MASLTGRREARERAVHLLYEADQRNADADALLAEQVLDPDPFTVEVIRGVLGDQDRLDATIGRFAKGWDIGRMPSLDLIVMRIATFELSEHPDTPTAVILNEAVELANTYGTDDSGRFVNGVLAAIAEVVRSPSGAGSPDASGGADE